MQTTYYSLLKPLGGLVKHLKPLNAFHVAAAELLRQRADAALELHAERAVEALAVAEHGHDRLARCKDAFIHHWARFIGAARK
jgi:hypothetical protein